LASSCGTAGFDICGVAVQMFSGSQIVVSHDGIPSMASKETFVA
jgi:hypothetical protein